jgi:hypothetical protein
MVVLLNTIGAREALYAYVTLNERLAAEVSTIRRIGRGHEYDWNRSYKPSLFGEPNRRMKRVTRTTGIELSDRARLWRSRATLVFSPNWRILRAL